MRHLRFLIACFLFAWSDVHVAKASDDARPNIVVLLADDHSVQDMSVYGAPDFPTPHLDRMAAAGMVFDRAFVNSPSCAPSRASLFTGMYPARNGAEPNHSKPRDDIKRLPAWLKELGYEVVSFGKTSHYGHVKDQGFDVASGFEYHDHSCVQASIDFLKTRKNGKPLALFFGTHWPHVPLPEAEGVDPQTVRIRPSQIDTPAFREYRARYVTAVKKMDEEIGAVYEAAKETLGTKNTFFLQTSDHGSQFPFGKWNLYDDGIRVPMIVHWEGKIAAGSRTKAMVQWIDILPTLVEVAGGKAPSGVDGRSFVPVLSDSGRSHRDTIFTTHTGDGAMNVYPCRSMTTSRWHYIRNLHPEYRHTTHIDRVAGKESDYWQSWEQAASTDPHAAKIVQRYRQRPANELYDLESDPFELNNLAAEPAHAARLQEMSTALDEWMKATGDTQLVAGKPSLLSEPLPPAQPAKKNSPAKQQTGPKRTSKAKQAQDEQTQPQLAAAEKKTGEMAGYLLVPNEKVPKSFDAGFSMYIAAWPLLEQYPGQRFQSGLPGTWMFAQPVDKPLEKGYSDIEGGLGWWRDTEYATETPKFIMGGVAPDFIEWANGPGAGKGRDWAKPNGKYAIAQLSPWVLWPPDGLNLKQGVQGEWFGYGYLPLPLTDPKTQTDGKDIPTGNQCWTLFLNTGNFKGPVTFFTPYFWSRNAVRDPRFAGQLLDTRPSDPNRALQMETQHIPSVQATDSRGVTYARVSPTQFPSDADGNSVLAHRVTSYNRQALWDSVQSWFNGGEVASGAVDSAGAVLHEFPGRGGATWQIYSDGTKREDKVAVAWNSFANPFAPDKNTFGYKWNSEWVKRNEASGGSLVTLPEYFRLGQNERQKPVWTPVPAAEVPEETGLAEVRFDRKRRGVPKTYETPEDADSCWKIPGPKAGPFKAYPGDGSVVTYYWYRFADQPAMLNAGLTDEEREVVQSRVEQLHRHWTKDREYLAPPASGQLADLDPAMIVLPPQGLEVGYVPIVTRQEPAAENASNSK